MAPGIEPGNLIRSTLIRYPPGPFLLNLSNNKTAENIVTYNLCFRVLLLAATTDIKTKAELTKKIETNNQLHVFRELFTR